jgi:hypothetical protein
MTAPSPGTFRNGIDFDPETGEDVVIVEIGGEIVASIPLEPREEEEPEAN